MSTGEHIKSHWGVSGVFIKKKLRGATVAQWNRLRLQSCHPGFESQAFIKLNLNCDMLKRRKLTEKEYGIGPFLKKI